MDLKDLIAESNSHETSIVRDALTYGKWPTTNTDPDVKLYCDIKDDHKSLLSQRTQNNAQFVILQENTIRLCTTNPE